MVKKKLVKKSVRKNYTADNVKMKLKYNKILLRLVTQHNTKHNYKIYGVGTTYKGWKLVDWNLLPLLYKKLNKSYEKKGFRIKKHKNWINIDSLSSLKNEIKKIPKNFYFVDSTDNIRINIFLSGLLSILGGKRIIIHSGSDWVGHQSKLRILKDLFSNDKIFLLRKIFKYFLFSFKKFLVKLLRTKAKIFFAGNYVTYLNFKNVYRKIYKIDSPEFTNFLNLKERKNKSIKNILYLDQDIPQAFDFKIGNKATTLDKEKFLVHLEKVFCVLENKFKYFNLTIAAHPRRNTNNIPIKRKFIFDQTIYLIKNSDLIFTHHSLALKYAVLLRKPIVFLLVEMLKREMYAYESVLKFYAKELGSKIITTNSFFLNNEKKINMKSLFEFDEKKYKKFEENYIGFPGLKSRGRWKTILKHLDNNMFN